LLAAENHAYFRTYLIASVAGIYSLFPLLFTPAESLIKLIYSLVWVVMVLVPIQRRVYEFPRSPAFVILDALERLYLAGFVPLHLIVAVLPYALGPSKEFLPLLLTSVYCAVGLVWAFIRLSVIYLRSKSLSFHTTQAAQ